MPADDQNDKGEKLRTPKYDAIVNDLVWKIITDVWLLVQRSYFSAVLHLRQTCAHTINKALLPLEPVFEQVRKVPPKDVSCQGIMYQFLRLQFIILLFLYPLVAEIVKYIVVKPLALAKEHLLNLHGLQSREAPC